MSLIPPCQLCAANSLDYLIGQQRLARHLAGGPAERVPWNYRETIKGAKV